MKRYFVIFGVVIVLMLFAARKESGKKVDIDKVEHGHIVHPQKENTTMLRSTSNTTTASKQKNKSKVTRKIAIPDDKPPPDDNQNGTTILESRDKFASLSFNTRDDFGHILEKEKFKIGVELGVQRGHFAEKTLSGWHGCERYVLVDLWAKQKNYIDLANNYDHARIKKEALHRMKPFREKGVNIEVCHNYTSSCVGNYEDGTFDYIYVDARHDFKGVYIDIVEWWSKLRVGGIMAGHDYVTQFEGPQTGQDWTRNFDGTIDETHSVVKGAVDKFAQENNLIINTGSGETSDWPRNTYWPSWAIRKKKKSYRMDFKYIGSERACNINPQLSICKPIKGSENKTMAYRERRKSNKTCVVSVIAGPKFSNFSKRLINNKQNYCTQMGFKCHIFNNSLLSDKRPLAWQKVYAIDTVLHMDDCSRLLWLDGDAIVMQPVNLPETTRNIALTKDHNGINTGVMIIKNTEWSDRFFHRVANTTTFNNHPWWEQAAIRHFIQTERKIEKHIEYIPHEIYNSYNINKTPFIYHTAGCGSNCFDKWKTAFAKINKNHAQNNDIQRVKTKCENNKKYYQHSRVKYTEETAALMKITLRTLLSNIVNILNILNVKYTLGHGTLIGWARCGDFLEWDDDIDIRVHSKDWAKLSNIYKTASKVDSNYNITRVTINDTVIQVPFVQSDKRLSQLHEKRDINFRVLDIGYTELNHYTLVRDDIHLDLVSAECVDTSWATCFWRDITDAFTVPLIHTTMSGINVTVTPLFDSILTRQYGKNWRVPN